MPQALHTSALSVYAVIITNWYVFIIKQDGFNSLVQLGINHKKLHVGFYVRLSFRSPFLSKSILGVGHAKELNRMHVQI